MNNNPNDILMNLPVVKQYQKMMSDNLRASFPGLTEGELNEAITWAILNNYKNAPARLDNTYTHQSKDTTILAILEYIRSREPIICSSGVLFKRHEEMNNPFVDMVLGFLAAREKERELLRTIPIATFEYAKHTLLSTLEKLNARHNWRIFE